MITDDCPSWWALLMPAAGVRATIIPADTKAGSLYRKTHGYIPPNSGAWLSNAGAAAVAM